MLMEILKNTDMSRILKVGMVQQSCGKDIAANIAKLEANIRDCASKGAQLVVLQELHNSVYFCQTEEAALCDLAEPIPGPLQRSSVPSPRNWESSWCSLCSSVVLQVFITIPQW